MIVSINFTVYFVFDSQKEIEFYNCTIFTKYYDPTKIKKNI